MRRYRLYVDESGNHHATSEGASNQYLGLLGVIVDQSSYRDKLLADFSVLKAKYFGDDPDSPVILHREDLVKRSGPFRVLADSALRNTFNRDIVAFYGAAEITIIAVVIDKLAHYRRHGTKAKHPYHYAAEALLERYCFFLGNKGAIGDVFAESRGAKEDRQLTEAWSKFIEYGTTYVSPERIARRLASFTLEFRCKAHNVMGLQLADLLAFTCTRDVLINEGRVEGYRDALSPYIAHAIESKYDRNPGSGKIRGYGRVLLK